MSEPISSSPDSRDAGWDPFSDDLVTPASRKDTGTTAGNGETELRGKNTNVGEGERLANIANRGDSGNGWNGKSVNQASPRGEMRGNEASVWDAETPVAVPNPQRAAQMETDLVEPLVPTRKPAVIVPDAPSSLAPERLMEPLVTIPRRPESLPEERLIRPQARRSVPPPASDDDIYAIREEPEPPAPDEGVESTTRVELVASLRVEEGGTRDSGQGPGTTTKSNDPWKAIFDGDEVPATWQRANRVANGVAQGGSAQSGSARRTSSVTREGNTGNTTGNPRGGERTAPAISVPLSPGQRLRDAAAQRQLELLEANAQRKIQEEEERIRDASLTVWEFFRQGAVLGRILLLSTFGIVLSGLLSIETDDSRFIGLFRLAMAFGGGGVLLIIFLSLLLLASLDTFELSFSRSERLNEWPVGSGVVDGIFAIRYPIVAMMTASFAVVFVEVILLVFSLVWMLIPGLAGGLTVAEILRGCTVIAAPLTLFFIFPLCYMTALANNDVFDTVPVAVWTTRRTIVKRLGRFYLEQILILIALFAGSVLVGLFHESAPVLYYILSIGFVPPWTIFLCLLWHERLGRLAAACAEAGKER